jgi:hypothetical protein
LVALNISLPAKSTSTSVLSFYDDDDDDDDDDLLLISSGIINVIIRAA